MALRPVPVARLVPVGDIGSDLESLRDLERQGLMRLGRAKLPRDFWKLLRPRDAKAAVRKAVVRERDEGW